MFAVHTKRILTEPLYHIYANCKEEFAMTGFIGERGRGTALVCILDRPVIWSWAKEIKTKGISMHLRDDIYVYEWTDYFENNCNSYYIGGRVRALIDPGLSAFVPALLERMEKDGIAVSDIRYIVNTHSHPDHFEGSAYFDGPKTAIGLHRSEIEFLAGAGGDLYSMFGLKPPTLAIDWVLEEGEVLLGEDAFQLFHVPGHSPGSIALYSPSRGALFSGDLIFLQSVGRIDFPGGDGALLKNSIRRMSHLDIGCILPGHMGIVDGVKEVQNNFQLIVDGVFPYL